MNYRLQNKVAHQTFIISSDTTERADVALNFKFVDM